MLFAATSLYLDQNTRFYLLRRLFFRRASQNVVSPGAAPTPPPASSSPPTTTPPAPARSSARASDRAARRLPERARVPLGPIRLIFWAGIVPLLLISGLRMAGLDAGALDAVQLLPTLVLLISISSCVDIALSDPVPGAYDNASGVATVLSVAAELDADPPENLDVWVVLAGAEESQHRGHGPLRPRPPQGDRSRAHLLRQRRLRLVRRRSTTWSARARSSPTATDRRLIELCEAVADADATPTTRPVRIPLPLGRAPRPRPRLSRDLPASARRTASARPSTTRHDDTPDSSTSDAIDARASTSSSRSRARIDRDVARAADRDAAATLEPAPV